MFLDHTAVVPWDKILESMGMKTFLHAQVQCLEWQTAVVYGEASRRVGRPITQGINVWDMKGLTLSAFTAKVREISGATSKIAQDNYPESLAAAYVVNAPTVFSVIWAVVRQFLDPKTVAKVHIMGGGPKMFTKLKEALGPDCRITEDMVCCKKSDVGKAELDMGLQSAMAASQKWIRERAMSGIPWFRSAASVEALHALTDEHDKEYEPSSSSSSFLGASSGQSVTHLGGRGCRTPSAASVVSDGTDVEDQFFDAEEDAFSDFGDDTLREVEDDADEMRQGGGPASPAMEQFVSGKCMSAIMTVSGLAPTPLHESRVKLMEDAGTPSDGRSRGGVGEGADAGTAQAERDRARSEEDKDARAAGRCCGCC